MHLLKIEDSNREIGRVEVYFKHASFAFDPIRKANLKLIQKSLEVVLKETGSNALEQIITCRADQNQSSADIKISHILDANI